MDMLFANQKSIIENTYAKIFTDREIFVYFHYLKSKSQYGEGLDVVTRYIVVLNTLISDNSGEQTGP